MATFITLVNNVLTELNEPTLSTSADLSSASTTVGIQTSVKENINKSIRDIATSEVEWSYLYVSGTQALTAGIQEYTVSTAASTIDWDSFVLTPTELLTNGTFTSDISSWTESNSGTGDATYGHHYNYPLGRVVFDSAIPTTSTVQIEHSYRNVQTYIADQAPWWDELQYNSMRVDDVTFDQVSSGNWSILANHRVQMPAVVLEVVPRRRYEPYELGSSTNIITQDMLFHIVAESRWWRNQLVDIISAQKDKTLMLMLML